MGKERVLLLFLSRWNIDFAVCDDFVFQFYLKIENLYQKKILDFFKSGILYHIVYPILKSETNYLLTYITSLTALITRSGFGRYSCINVGA